MKKKYKLKKKPLLFLAVLIVLGIIGGVFAYYYSDTAIQNRFRAMAYDIAMEEEFYGTWGTKKVTIINRERGAPVVLRVNYSEVWKQEYGNSGVYLYLDNNVNGTSVVTKTWTEAFLNDFVLMDDGWYYYKKVFNPEESVQILESISLNEALIATSPYYEDYLNYDYELSFKYEAIQADVTAIEDIWDKTPSISGEGDVIWTT